MATTINMTGKNVNTNNESTKGVSQSFVTPWGTDPERYWERPDYAKAIAKTMMSQISAGLRNRFGAKWESVLASWGCVPMPGRVIGKVLRWREMPALALHVSGYQHEGWVVISLNEGSDTYELELTDEMMFAKEGSRREDVYCDELGERIDEMVETGTGSQADYEQQIEQDPANAEIIALLKHFPNLKHVYI